MEHRPIQSVRPGPSPAPDRTCAADDVGPPASDLWSDWLLHIRHGGNADLEAEINAELEPCLQRVLDSAKLGPGMTLADIGTGAGLVGFGAIDRIGPSLHVLMTDVSAPLLRHAQALAVQRGVASQCTLIECPADSLLAIQDNAVDAVCTRAVLAYVADKPAAMREFFRILHPGGRLSLSEPVMRDAAIETHSLREAVASLPDSSEARFLRLLHRWKAAQFPDTEEKISASALANYGERDLVRFALEAGFEQVHLELHIDVRPAPVTSWDVLLRCSPHPWAPTLETVLATQFTPAERLCFEQWLRPRVEARQLRMAERVTYLSGTKPMAHAG
ncbi:class I SAM-dependent methyltransferase [Burkholderia sp. Ac-20379]|uniref:class I SAM-dependent methyltransferase n=1 Tax=Burkholderia sp. Ac-20379 TaxID=2703900 RepID=UPI00197D0D32|nr:methyltransferase domain-containing protein [Burkholderia sp. Ac-20379]MBN3723065.1 methyltransferase domain-containing protein [Burkholderia sp. Ac-20379]